MKQTLVLCKPDAVERSLVGEIISRFEKKGLKIEALFRYNFYIVFTSLASLFE